MFRIFLVAALVSVIYAYVLPARKLALLPAPSPSGERIVGGVETNIEDVPYHVAFLVLGRYLCGGSIVKPDAVVTAAQCTRIADDDLPTAWVSIRAGSSRHDSGGQVVQCSKIFTHELYNSSNADYNIAVIALSSTISFSESAAPISLPLQGAIVSDGSVSVTSGWGYTVEVGEVTDVIRKVEIPIANQDDCNKAYMGILGLQISPRIICAGLLEGGKGTCQGDQGGPLVFNNTLVGVTLFGWGCGRPGYPTLYARVSEMSDWVNEKLSLIN